MLDEYFIFVFKLDELARNVVNEYNKRDLMGRESVNKLKYKLSSPFFLNLQSAINL